MALESVQVKPPVVPPLTRQQHWYRLRFRKGGDLRLVSHIDLLHVFERMMRRAALPFAVTQGFHPKACLVFAQALALGVAGLAEVVDLELREPLPAAELLACLNRHAPPGLVFLDARALGRKGSVQVRRAFYRLPLPSGADIPVGQVAAADKNVCPTADLPARCAELLGRERCFVERLRPQRRFVNIRPYLCELHADADALTMVIWITPDGAARPEEVVKALGLGMLLDAGAVLERTHLELLDELPADQRWFPAIPRLTDAALTPDEVVVAADEPQRTAAAGEALVESPMSYET